MKKAWRLDFLIIPVVCFMFVTGCGQRTQNLPRVTSPEKVLIFGVDAAGWDVLYPLCQDGFLPNFQRLIKTGIKANLKTLEPTVSVMLWTTIATGRLPENHGIKSWLMEGSDTSGQLAITSHFRKVPAIWNLKTEKQFLFSNWWATWPCESINGVMISNRAHMPELDHLVYPPAGKNTLNTIRRLASPELELELTELNPFDNPLKLSRFVSDQIKRDRFYLDAAAEFFSQSDFEIVGLFVRGIDILEHEYLYDVRKYEGAPQIEDNTRGIVHAYYRYLDKQLGRFIDLMGPSTSVIVVSDHGMDPVTSLPPMIEGLKLDELLSFLGCIPKNADGSLQYEKAAFRDNKRYPPGLNRGISCSEKHFQDSKEMLEKARILKQDLENITIDGKKLFNSVELTNNPMEFIKISMNPEPSPKSIVNIKKQKIPFLKLIDFIIHPTAGQHWNKPDGIFMMSGPGIRHMEDFQNIHICDVAPTIATLAGLPVAQDLDGKPAKHFFTDEFLTKCPVEWVASYGERTSTIPEIDTSAADNLIKNELKSLGYIQ